jgi:hypothetical protein
VNLGLHHYDPGPGLEDSGPARESLSLGSAKQVDLELYRENHVTRIDQRGSGPASCVISHGCLNTGVDEAVLLEVPGFHVKFRFADPFGNGHQANAEVRHERDGIEYPFQFLAWQLVELVHLCGTILRRQLASDLQLPDARAARPQCIEPAPEGGQTRQPVNREQVRLTTTVGGSESRH